MAYISRAIPRPVTARRLEKRAAKGRIRFGSGPSFNGSLSTHKELANRLGSLRVQQTRYLTSRRVRHWTLVPRERRCGRADVGLVQSPSARRHRATLPEGKLLS